MQWHLFPLFFRDARHLPATVWTVACIDDCRPENYEHSPDVVKIMCDVPEIFFERTDFLFISSFPIPRNFS